SREALVMVEGGASMVPEDVLLEALFTAHEGLQPLIKLQDDLRRAVGKPKRQVVVAAVNRELEDRVRERALPKLRQALSGAGKHERYAALDACSEEVVTALGGGVAEDQKAVAGIFRHLKREVVRETILHEGRRVDGRTPTDIRPITCEVEVLPRTHGSA